MTIETLEQHATLAESLMDTHVWPAGGPDRVRIETHISTVILAGEQAIKFKKPLNLGFLNFTSLSDRQHYCEQELRLNQRLCGEIYQRVVPITGSAEAPQLDGPGEPIDWAVIMRRFDPEALLSNPAQILTTELIDQLAVKIGQFHAITDSAAGGEYGSPEQTYAPMLDNLDALQQQPSLGEAVAQLRDWTEQTYQQLNPLMQQRYANGAIKECHGDLHLANIAMIDGQPTLFDAIEFNPGFRWIDPINDIAFLSMDLHQRGKSDLAQRLLDRYLQETGDYQGLPLLRLYEVYRALVRAKVTQIHADQPGLDDARKQALQNEVRGYVELAIQRTEVEHRGIVITHGVSGSGKSRVSRQLLSMLPAIRVRSDVERKRLLGLQADADASAHQGYDPAITQQTYQALAKAAQAIDQAGLVALIDATFLQQAQRQPFQQLAQDLGVAFLIIDCDAPADVLRQRILDRKNKPDNVSDADLAVLEQQLAKRDPLNPQEQAASLSKPVDGELDRSEVLNRLN